MSNNKQSSVEWLFDQLEKHYVKTDLKNTVVYQQAVAMHKEEIRKVWDNAAIDFIYGNKFKNFDDYYNETFGGNNDNS